MDLPLLSLEHLLMEQWVCLHFSSLLDVYSPCIDGNFINVNCVIAFEVNHWSVSPSSRRWMSTTRRRRCPSVTILCQQLWPVLRCVQHLRRFGECYDTTKLLWTVRNRPLDCACKQSIPWSKNCVIWRHNRGECFMYCNTILSHTDANSYTL